MSRVRCFVGLRLPSDVSAPLVSACEAIRREAPAWRAEKWVPESNMHVTLAFIGGVAEDLVEALADEIGAAVADSTSFELPFDGISAVPNTRRCRMVWAAFDDPSGCCAALAQRVVSASVPFGAEQPDRDFHAHATLARAHRSRPLPAEALEAGRSSSEALCDAMSVRSATLFASSLTPSGPVYRELRSWVLGRP